LGAQQAQAGLRQTGNVAQSVTQQVNQLSARREFMMGQRLQGTLTGAMGLDNGLTRTLDGFERLQYMAGASNMTVGSMLAKFGPMAVAVAVAAKAFQEAKDQVAGINQQLDAMGMKQIGFVDWLKLGVLGDTSVVQVDPKAMAAKTIRDMNRDLNLQDQLEAKIAANTKLSSAQRLEIAKAIKDEIQHRQTLLSLENQIAEAKRQQPATETDTVAKLDQRSKELARSIPLAKSAAESPQLPAHWRQDAARRAREMELEQEQLRLKRPQLVAKEAESADKRREDFAQKIADTEGQISQVKQKNWFDGLSAEKQRLALVQEIATLEQAARMTLSPADAAAYRLRAEQSRGKLAEMQRNDRAAALQPWMAEMQNPKGFASTTLSNSIEGVRAVNLAATMGERADATQRALAEQVRLLEDIRNNTGNKTQTTTVGAL
jgi:hypothetical protein